MAFNKSDRSTERAVKSNIKTHENSIRTSVNRSLVGPHYVDHRSCRVHVDRNRAFAPIRSIGGSTGWYHANFLWKIRGVLDQLCGGVGMRRGRTQANYMQVGDVIDCWRVDDYKDGVLLRLEGELKLPGRAWLQFEVHDHGDESEIAQTALFESSSIWGAVYWYSIYPAHAWIFRGMLRGIARAAEKPEHRCHDLS